MLPFCSCSGIRPQVTRMRLELMASAVTFSGAPDGTTQTEKDKSHSLIALCFNTRSRVLSKLMWNSHLSNAIREKRKQTALACEQQIRLWAWEDSEQTNKRRKMYQTAQPAQNVSTCGLLFTQLYNDSLHRQTTCSDYGHPSAAFQITIYIEVCIFWSTSGTKWNCNLFEWDI